MNVLRLSGSRSSTSFLKVIILGIIALVVLLAALSFRFAVKDSGNNESRLQFVRYADRITGNFNDRIHSNLLALDSLSVSSTSYALDTKKSWPTITLPDFAIRGLTTRQEMGAETLGLLPIVTNDKRQEWEGYVKENHEWISEAREWDDKNGQISAPSSRSLLKAIPPMISNRSLENQVNFSDGISSHIYTINMEGAAVVDEGMGPFSPIWLTSPAPKDTRMINFNMLSHHLFWQGIEDCMYSRLSVLSRVLNYESIGSSVHSTDSGVQIIDEPISSIIYPVFDNFEENSTLVATLAAEIHWGSLLKNSLPYGAIEVICVFETACDQVFSFKIAGSETSFLGYGDYHDQEFNSLVQTRGPKTLIEKDEGFTGTPLDLGHCPFLLHMYPTSSMIENNFPFRMVSLALCIIALFTTIAFIFVFFENPFAKNGENDMDKTKAHFASKKPVRGQIVGNPMNLWKLRGTTSMVPPKHLKDVIEHVPKRPNFSKRTEKVMLTNATLMVAEICSLEKWGENKTHEETTDLLEKIKQSLGVIAKRHGIPRVELIDTKFLVILGSNESKINHAEILVYFACECRKRVSDIFKSMPTKELSIRFGVHSGAMKKENSSVNGESDRFELFGDTVDIAFEMLENGKENRIQVSSDTAELLNLHGNSHWVSLRSDSVPVKGIGNMSTFWVKPKACLSTVKPDDMLTDKEKDSDPTCESISGGIDWKNHCDLSDISEKEFQRLVDTNTTILLRYLRQIHAKRLASKQNQQKRIVTSRDGIEIGGSILEEARESVQAANFDLEVSMNPVDPSIIEISHEVQSQLHVYVASIGAAYRKENPFHNFQHASHTISSLDQMIGKITSSSNILKTDFDGTRRTPGEIAKELDRRTFSIDSDPIIQFAMIFSALIHNVDHMGVTNQQLVKNGSPLSSLYKKRCISQQNSVDISWWLLMKADFEDLRYAIFSDVEEQRRFRQVIVNTVIATDILDSKMKQHREIKWNKVFGGKAISKRRNCMDTNEIRNIQATSIIEHMMQVADSGHRMESYRTYLKWNERLFEEALKAYYASNSEANPAAHWYQFELDYFDSFLIPSLSRLAETGIFGGSCESYLTRASENRRAWESGGEVIVRDMMNGYSRRVVAVQEDTIHFS